MHTNDECGVRVSRTAAGDGARSPASPDACAQPAGASLTGRARGWLRACLGRARRRAHLRRDLERLDSRMLHDMGVRREDLVREACRPFWRA